MKQNVIRFGIRAYFIHEIQVKVTTKVNGLRARSIMCYVTQRFVYERDAKGLNNFVISEQMLFVEIKLKMNGRSVVDNLFQITE